MTTDEIREKVRSFILDEILPGEQPDLVVVLLLHVVLAGRGAALRSARRRHRLSAWLERRWLSRPALARAPSLTRLWREGG